MNSGFSDVEENRYYPKGHSECRIMWRPHNLPADLSETRQEENDKQGQANNAKRQVYVQITIMSFVQIPSVQVAHNCCHSVPRPHAPISEADQRIRLHF